METLEKLRTLYEEYYQLMDQARQEERGLKGAMGVFILGAKTREGASAQFNLRLQEIISGLSPEEAVEPIFDFMLQEAWEHRNWTAVALMLTAVQGSLIPLIGRLDPEKRRELSLWYNKNYPRLDCTPVMKKLKKALEKG